ncbi:MAG: hypothetical protein AB2L24_26590 [Mangrovibacterium sp.]
MNYPNRKTIGRRDFLKVSLVGGISVFSLPLTGSTFFTEDRRSRLSLDTAARLFDGNYCWAHPRAGIVSKAGKDRFPRVVMTMNKLDLSGSDVFRGMYGLQTDNFGAAWTSPHEIELLAPRYETIDSTKRLVVVSDFWPAWHKASRKLLGIGHTVVYTSDWKIANPRPHHTSYAVYHPDDSTWSDWQKLEMPDAEKFYKRQCRMCPAFTIWTTGQYCSRFLFVRWEETIRWLRLSGVYSTDRNCVISNMATSCQSTMEPEDWENLR